MTKFKFSSNTFVLDTDFDNDGFSPIDFNSGSDYGNEVEILPSGRIVAAGQAVVSGPPDFGLVGLDGLDGSLDSSFDTDGKLAIDFGGGPDFAQSIAVDQYGGILVVGNAWINGHYQFALGRLYGDTVTHNITVRSLTTLQEYEDVMTEDTETNLGLLIEDPYCAYTNTITELEVAWGDGDTDNWDIDLYEPGDPIYVVTGDNWYAEHTYAADGLYSVNIEAVDNDNDVNNPYALSVAGKRDIGISSFPFLWFTPAFFSSDLIAEANAMIIQPDGRVIVAGYVYDGENESTKDFAITRFTKDGESEIAFTFDFGGRDEIRALALQEIGGEMKLLAAGVSDNGGDDQDFVLMRFDLDTLHLDRGTGGFGDDSDGVTLVDFNSGDDIANAITVDASGNIVVVGTAEDASGNACLAAVRYLSNGTIDTNFASGGKFISPNSGGVDTLRAAALDASGNTVAVGERDGKFVLARFDSTGADANFGTGGILGTAIDGYLTGVAVDSNDRIVASGYTYDSVELGNFTVVCYWDDPADNPDNGWQLDDSFGTNGRTDTDFNGDYEWPTGMAIQSDGKIIVSGYEASSTDIAIARYTSNGELDSTFDDDGKLFVSTRYYGIWEQGKAIAIDARGGIYVAANYCDRSGTPNDNHIFAIRLFSDGLTVVVVPEVTLDEETVVDPEITGQSSGTTYVLAWDTADAVSEDFTDWVIDWGDGNTDTLSIVSGTAWDQDHVYTTDKSRFYDISLYIRDERGVITPLTDFSHQAAIDCGMPFPPVLEKTTAGIEWTAMGSTYTIERSREGYNWETDWDSLDTTDVTMTTFTAMTQNPDFLPYYYRVKAINGASESAYSNIIFFDTGQYDSYSSTMILTSSVNESLEQISLMWFDDPDRADGFYRISRFSDTNTWEIVADDLFRTNLQDANGLIWTDVEVDLETNYYYRVEYFAGSILPSAYREGYVWAMPAGCDFENRGAIVLLVDDRFSDSLSYELERLEADLVGDGWQVIRHDVDIDDPEGDGIGEVSGEWAHEEVKSIISDYYTTSLQDSDTTNDVKAVYLFGHIPVVRSGWGGPDGHGSRSMPADAYYGDVVVDPNNGWTDNEDYGSWTYSDNTAFVLSNYADDGIFDQNEVPGDGVVELAVGRVDMYEMGEYYTWRTEEGWGFAESECELLRRYLDKDHAYRNGQWEVEQKANFADVLSNDCASMWGSLSAVIGPENIVFPESNLVTDTNGEVFSWGLISSTGSQYAILTTNYKTPTLSGNEKNFGLATTKTGCFGEEYLMNNQNDFLTTSTVFNTLCASYSVDWDYPDNLLRAVLANDGYGLTISWVPGWYSSGNRFYQNMGLGATTGEVHRITQNTPASNAQVHFGLLGDPTLRQHVVAPTANVKAVDSGDNVEISWNASADADDDGSERYEGVFQGYHVYRADADRGDGKWGDFVCITTTGLITSGETYVDINPGNSAEDYVYMVRAVKLEETPSGSYYNASQGAYSTAILDIDAGSDANDDDADTFLVTRNGDDIEVYVNDSLALSTSAATLELLTIAGSSDDDSVTVEDLGSDLAGKIVIHGGEGTDTIDIYDSSETDDEFIVDPSFGITSGLVTMDYDYGNDDLIEIRAHQFEVITGYATDGDTDKAQIKDTSEDDVFTAYRRYSTLSGNGRFIKVEGFADVDINADYGGTDTAMVFDSVVNPGMTVTGYSKGIIGVIIEADLLPEAEIDVNDFVFEVYNDPTWTTTGAAPDNITVYPGAGTNGTDQIAISWEDNSIVNQWLAITVLASGDVGEAYDLENNESLYFGSLRCDTDSDGDVDLTDLGNFNDGWYGPDGTDPTYPIPFASLVTGDYDFDGDVDLTDLGTFTDGWNGDPLPDLQLTSSEVINGYLYHRYTGDDTFNAEAGISEMSFGSNSSLYPQLVGISGFDIVQAYSTGGSDKAYLYGSTGDDVFEGKYDYSSLTSTGFFNKAIGFDEVHADLGQGGSDEVYLYDSSGDDTLSADDDWAQMLRAIGTSLCRVSGLDALDTVFAHHSDGDDDDDIVTPLYTLDLTYWI